MKYHVHDIDEPIEDEEVDLDQLEIIKSNIADEEYNELRDLCITNKEK